MEPNPKKDLFKKKPLNDYGRYAGLGIQMMGAILVLTWLGNWLDHTLHFQYPLLTLTGAILGIVAAMFWLFNSLPKR